MVGPPSRRPQRAVRGKLVEQILASLTDPKDRRGYGTILSALLVEDYPGVVTSAVEDGHRLPLEQRNPFAFVVREREILEFLVHHI